MIIYSNDGNVEINENYLIFKDKKIPRPLIDLIEITKCNQVDFNNINSTLKQSKSQNLNYVVITYEDINDKIDEIIIPYNSEEDAKLTSNTLNSWLSYGISLEDESNHSVSLY